MRIVQNPEGLVFKNQSYNISPDSFIKANVAPNWEFYVPFQDHIEVWSWKEDLSSFSLGQICHIWRKQTDEGSGKSLQEAINKFSNKKG
jgi:hypothetical protein